jgi:hypothetical protein
LNDLYCVERKHKIADGQVNLIYNRLDKGEK